jgi:pimeloyl-ACP methyl ester carboxylesterase
MSVHDRSGEPVPFGPGIAAAFPSATGHLVLLVHGLMESERCWDGTDITPGMVRAIEEHPGLTPVAVRYNTGLSIESNGARLASLVEALHDAWPLPVQSISIVGHSMGGLIARGACVAGVRAGHRWIEDVTDVVTIGTPHEGAPLEKFANLVAWGLGVTSQTRPLADFLDSRSRGIKDLRFGTIDDAEDTLGALSHIDHHLVGGVVTSNPDHPVGAIVGDLMVRPASSTRARGLDPTNVLVVGSARHSDLLHDSAVIDTVVRWLAPTR